MKTNSADDLIVERSSGNVFADIGLENADELLLRADIIIAIQSEIRTRRLSKKRAFDLIGLTDLEISNIIKADIDPVTQGQLMRALERLGLDVNVVTRRSRAAIASSHP